MTVMTYGNFIRWRKWGISDPPVTGTVNALANDHLGSRKKGS